MQRLDVFHKTLTKPLFATGLSDNYVPYFKFILIFAKHQHALKMNLVLNDPNTTCATPIFYLSN